MQGRLVASGGSLSPFSVGGQFTVVRLPVFPQLERYRNEFREGTGNSNLVGQNLGVCGTDYSTSQSRAFPRKYITR